MARVEFGRTLVIANPASHSGDGERASTLIERALRGRLATQRDFELTLIYTEGPGDGGRAAAEAADYDTVIASGGDGIIHEVVGGLMRIDADRRPRLGVVPLGSGNDFARTLGLPRNKVELAAEQLVGGREIAVDLGRATSDMCPEGVHFVETLSFGLDAAIALDTIERRRSGTSQKGAKLFATSGLKIFSRGTKGWTYRAVLDDGREFSGAEVIFACQVGPTYGGGFRVCPDASPTDGLLDLCVSDAAPLPKTLSLFALARFGLHTHAKNFFMPRVGSFTVEFDEDVPVQTDGEPFHGRRFEVECVPAALRVLVPKDSALH